MAERILLVEDEESLQEIVRLNLELEGYEVTAVSTGGAALSAFRAGRFGLVILDVMLPEADGFTICQAIRLQDQRVPVLFLTAKSAPEDRVFGLKVGGDDYLTKPFNLEEFILRVQALLRRGGGALPKVPDTFAFGRCRVDFKAYAVTGHDGKEHKLSEREMRLLRLFVQRRNHVLSRDEILDEVWGSDAFPGQRTIDNYILAFRKYFEEEPSSPRHFISVRSVGYKFVA